jgi:tRNA methyl transferase
VQYRAHGAALPATITATGNDQVQVEFDEPTRGVAPGQSMVFFDTTRVVGSATISETS